MDRGSARLRALAGSFIVGLSTSAPLVACEEHKPAYAEAVDSGAAEAGPDTSPESSQETGPEASPDTGGNAEAASDAGAEAD